MKITRKKINNLIRESIRSVLFESRFESMSAEELLAVDPSELTDIEQKQYDDVLEAELAGNRRNSAPVVDDFDLEDNDETTGGTSRRSFLKGAAGTAAALAGGKYISSAMSGFDASSIQINSSTFLSSPPYDLNNLSHVKEFTSGFKSLNQVAQFNIFIDYNKSLARSLFSALNNRFTTREFIEKAMMLVKQEIEMAFETYSAGLSHKEKLALGQLYYEYYRRVADYIGTVPAETIFSLLYIGNKPAMLPESLVLKHGISEDEDVLYDAYEEILDAGYLDTVFVKLGNNDEVIENLATTLRDRTQAAIAQEIQENVVLVESNLATKSLRQQRSAIQKEIDSIHRHPNNQELDGYHRIYGNPGDEKRLEQLYAQSQEILSKIHEIESPYETSLGIDPNAHGPTMTILGAGDYSGYAYTESVGDLTGIDITKIGK
tara:strand:- start:104 stop:1402 length:1299 start_codon:yes stop_codon:yes gene_type:complete